MWKDFTGFTEMPKRFNFMRLKYPNLPVYTLEDIKTLYIIMTLRLRFRDITDTAELLEIDRKTVKKYYLKNKDLFDRIKWEDAMLFFHGDEFRAIKTLDDSLVKKPGRKSRYSF